MILTDIDNIDILIIQGVDYCGIIFGISKGEFINLLKMVILVKKADYYNQF